MAYKAINLKQVTPGYFQYQVVDDNGEGTLQHVFTGTRRETLESKMREFLLKLEASLAARLDSGTMPKVSRDAYNDMRPGHRRRNMGSY